MRHFTTTAAAFLACGWMLTGTTATAHAGGGNPPFVSDGTFAANNWATSLAATLGSGGTFTAARATTGGNPAERWNVTHTLNAAPAAAASGLFAVHRRLRASFDPVFDGTIGRLTMSADAMPTAAAQELRFAVFQNGQIFVTLESFSTGSIPTGTWATISMSGLTAADFSARINGVLPAMPFPPDFGPEAAPLSFGFETSNLLPPAAAAMTTQASYDNFAVTISAAPGCNPADLAEAFDTLDINDILTFATLFNALDPAADFFADGMFDINDILNFAAAFNAGCP